MHPLSLLVGAAGLMAVSGRKWPGQARNVQRDGGGGGGGVVPGPGQPQAEYQLE